MTDAIYNNANFSNLWAGSAGLNTSATPFNPSALLANPTGLGNSVWGSIPSLSSYLPSLPKSWTEGQVNPATGALNVTVGGSGQPGGAGQAGGNTIAADVGGSNWFMRAVVIVLGFIFVAAGLRMFGVLGGSSPIVRMVP